MAPHIVIVEDDHLQEGPLEEYLNSSLPGATVTTLCTEEEFRQRLPQMRDAAPDLVVLDVMLRWTFPSPGAPAPPEDVATGGYYRAGLRCAALLLADERLRKVPVVLYTILERSDLERDGKVLPSNSTYVGKSSDMDVLIRKIKLLLDARSGSATPTYR
jgi:DNA-binding NarL/FixJ family response regulator